MEDKGKKIDEYFGELGYMYSHDLLINEGSYSSFYDCKLCAAIVHNDNLDTHIKFHEKDVVVKYIIIHTDGSISLEGSTKMGGVQGGSARTASAQTVIKVSSDMGIKVIKHRGTVYSE